MSIEVGVSVTCHQKHLLKASRVMPGSRECFPIQCLPDDGALEGKSSSVWWENSTLSDRKTMNRTKFKMPQERQKLESLSQGFPIHYRQDWGKCRSKANEEGRVMVVSLSVWQAWKARGRLGRQFWMRSSQSLSRRTQLSQSSLRILGCWAKLCCYVVSFLHHDSL